MEPICPLHQKFWIKEQTQMPLESDVLALEFLASYDYNVDKALFGLYCELGRGKGKFSDVYSMSRHTYVLFHFHAS